MSCFNEQFFHLPETDRSVLATNCIIVVIVLIAIPALTFGLMMLLTRTKVKRTKVEHRRRISKRLSSVMTSPETSGADSEVFVVVENQGESDFTDRQITLLVTSTEIRLIVGHKSMAYKYEWLKSIHIHTASDNGQLLVMNIPKQRDLILTFSSRADRFRFIRTLRGTAKDYNVRVDEMDEVKLMQLALTAKKRNKQLETLLKVCFRDIMDMKELHRPRQSNISILSDTSNLDVVETDVELTLSELGMILGETTTARTQRIFDLMDEAKEGTVNPYVFKNFFLMLIFGTSDEKAEILKNAYNADISIESLTEIIDVVKVRLKGF